MPGRPLSRRATVGTAALLALPLTLPLGLGACDIDPPARTAGTGGADAEPPEDAALVASVAAAVATAAGTVAAASAVAPTLAGRLDALSASHAAHLDLLADALPDNEVTTPDGIGVPGRPPAALAAVRRTEQQLLRTLREACVGASSGDLARVLASMAASTSQHLATLSEKSARTVL